MGGERVQHESGALQPLTVPQVVEAVTQALLAFIVSKGLSAGDELPSQATLAAQLGVGRNSLREAIQRLVALSVIHVERGRRMVVASALERPGASIVDLDSALRRRALYELAEVRSLLEPEVAALACVRASDAQLRGLEAILRDMSQARTPDDALRLNLAFHRVLADGAGNDAAARLLQTLEESFAQLYQDLYRKLYSLYADRDEASQHAEILRAALARDPERMRGLMREHIQESLLNEVRATYPPSGMPPNDRPRPASLRTRRRSGATTGEPGS